MANSAYQHRCLLSLSYDSWNDVKLVIVVIVMHVIGLTWKPADFLVKSNPRNDESDNREKLLFDFVGHFFFCIVMYYRCIHFIGSHFTCKWKGDLRKIFSCHIYGLSPLQGICYTCTMTTFSYKRMIFFAFESYLIVFLNMISNLLWKCILLQLF